MKYRLLLAPLSVLLPVVCFADDAPPPPPQGQWTGKGQVGFLASQGNSEAKSANALIDMSLLEDPWKHSLHLGGLYGETAHIVAAERWDALWQSNYDFTKTLYVFGALRYAHDMFSGFQYQASGSTGLGYKIIDSSAVQLSAQLGAGYRRSRAELIVKDASGAVVSRTPLESTGDAVVTAGVDYSQALTGTTTLSDKLLVESGSSNTLVTNALALSVKMSNRLALSLGYNLQNNSKPPVGLKKLDTSETVNLVFAF
jgi:putative salt-induced outer membrane protein